MKNDTLHDAILQYLDRGFGSMNKNDFEVFIFNYLVQNEFADKSDNAISRELRIPETKVKRLRYEAALKYPNDKISYKDRFYKTLESCVYKQLDSNRIQFSITDKALRLYLDDMLEEKGSFADSSFNSNIVTLTACDLMLLIANFEGKKELISLITESISKSSKTFPQEKKELLHNGAIAVLKDVGNHFAPNVTDFLSDYFNQITE